MVKGNLFDTFKLVVLLAIVLDCIHTSHPTSVEQITFPSVSLQENDEAFDPRRLEQYFLSSSDQLTVPTVKERSHSPRHSINISVGTPPQILTVRIDTGSPLTAFPCVESLCDDHSSDCYNKNGDPKENFFSPQYSTTFHKFNCSECRIGRRQPGDRNHECNDNDTHTEYHSCNVSVTMMDNREISSWTGYETRDVAYFIGTPQDMIFSDVELIQTSSSRPQLKTQEEDSFDLVFDCQTSEAAASSLENGGIMGMSNDPNSIWSEMYRSGVISRRAFSICLGVDGEGMIGSNNGGALTFGGVDTRLHSSSSPMLFAKNTQTSSGLFKVWVNNIYLRNVILSDVENKKTSTVRVDIDQDALNGDGIILDSGRMESYFTNELEGPFQAAWKQMTGNKYNNNPISDLDLSMLPTILFDLQVAHPVAPEGMVEQDDFDFIDTFSESLQVIVEMPASHYMQRIEGTKKYKPQLYVKYDESGSSVLGANFMQGHNILFDVDNHRIGFAVSNCTIPLPPSKPRNNWEEDKQIPPILPYDKETVVYCTSTRCILEGLAGLWLAMTIACLSWTCCDCHRDEDATNSHSKRPVNYQHADQGHDGNKQRIAQLV